MPWLRNRRRLRHRHLKRAAFRKIYPTMSWIATALGLIGLIATVVSALSR
ncbi:MAG: hypothetical protein Q8R35_00915 [bacterium]|nr:hypothetical protein [bacterium]